MLPTPASESRAPRGALLVAVLVALPVVVEALLASRLLGPLEHTLFPDDAFYYLCVGRNIAGGLGPTFDGVHVTTGFQPLWQGVVALVALGPFDPSTLTAAVAATNLACLAAAVAIVAVALRRRGLRPGLWTLAVLVALANPYLLKTSLNGMESGLVWLWWSLAIVVLTRRLEGRSGAADAAVAGVLAGAALLTRLDALGLVFVLGWVTTAASDRGRGRAALAFIVSAGVVAGPYFAWLWIRFGHWLPVSVLVKSGSAEPSVPAVVVLGALFIAAVVLLTHRARLSRGRGSAYQPAPVAAALTLLAGLLPLAVYAVVHRARLTHLWYYPAALTGALTLASLVASALWARRQRSFVVAAAIVGVALAAGVWALRLGVHHGDEHYRVTDAMGRRLASLPPGVRVAGWNVGLVGYRHACRVTNLDGLVNSYEYLGVLRDRTVASWLDREGITGLVEYFDSDPFAVLASRDPALPGRVRERFRMTFDYVGPLTVSGRPRRRAYIYFDYGPAHPPAASAPE